MLGPTLLKTLYLLAKLSSTASLPTRPGLMDQQVLQSDHESPKSLLTTPSEEQRLPKRPFEFPKNLVGLWFIVPDDSPEGEGRAQDFTHLLPIGRRVYTRHHTQLPLHILKVQMTSILAEDLEKDSSEHLAEIECKIFPGFGGPMQMVDRTSALPTEFASRRVVKADGWVDVSDMFGPEAWEIEGFECS